MSRSRSRSPEPAAAPAADAGGDTGAEVKLYIGNISFDSDENRLKEVFGAHATVTDAFIPIGRETGRPRGFAFVTVSDKAGADECIAKLDQTELDGRTIRVNESKPKGTPENPGAPFNSSGAAEVKLYVGNLSYDTTTESLKALFEQFGAVSDCFLPTDRESGRVRGFGFVTMPADDAKVAVEKAAGAELDGRALRVNEAQPKRQQQGGGGGGWGGGG
mmetsp:Transcript_25424/g.47771  ORF Transcript_25424/g.47771 Transcript_25424/m.47771 type:complete len:218 (+) Transcript_25424:53-706(+)